VHHAILTLSAAGAKDPLGLTATSPEPTNWMREEINDASDEAREQLAIKNNQAAEEIAQTLIGGVANQDNVREPLRREAEDEMVNFGVPP